MGQRKGRKVRSKSSVTSKTQSQKSKKTRKRPDRKVIKRILREGKYIPIYSIPKSKVEEAKKFLEERTFKRYSTQYDGCHVPPREVRLSRTSEPKKHSMRQLLAECRDCLLNRDWTNLAGLLSLPKETNNCYILRYAAICLLFCGEQESLDHFLHAVVGCTTENDKEQFLNSLTTFCDNELKIANKLNESKNTSIEEINSN